MPVQFPTNFHNILGGRVHCPKDEKQLASISLVSGLKTYFCFDVIITLNQNRIRYPNEKLFLRIKKTLNLFHARLFFSWTSCVVGRKFMTPWTRRCEIGQDI